MRPIYLRRGLFWTAALAVAGLATWLSLRGVHWRETAAVVKQADLLLLAAALGTVLATSVAKAARWHLLLRRCAGQVTASRTLRVLLIGQMGNNFLPARLGDAARAVLVGPQVSGGAPAVLGTLVVEKALDGAAGLLIMAGLALCSPLPSWLRSSALAISVCVEAALVLLILAAAQRRRASQIFRTISRCMPGSWQKRAGQTLARFGNGLASLRRPSDALQAIGWSLAVWALAVSTNLLLRAALHLQAPGWVDWLILITVYFATLIPTLPAQLGVFEYACVLALSAAGAAPGSALAFALILHVLVFAPAAVLGPICTAIEGLKWSSLKRAGSAAQLIQEK